MEGRSARGTGQTTNAKSDYSLAGEEEATSKGGQRFQREVKLDEGRGGRNQL